MPHRGPVPRSTLTHSHTHPCRLAPPPLPTPSHPFPPLPPSLPPPPPPSHPSPPTWLRARHPPPPQPSSPTHQQVGNNHPPRHSRTCELAEEVTAFAAETASRITIANDRAVQQEKGESLSGLVHAASTVIRKLLELPPPPTPAQRQQWLKKSREVKVPPQLDRGDMERIRPSPPPGKMDEKRSVRMAQRDGARAKRMETARKGVATVSEVRFAPSHPLTPPLTPRPSTS
jgi:hypothetical protein